MDSLYEQKTKVKSLFIDESVLNEIREFMGEEGDATVADLVSIYLRNTPGAIARISDDLKNNDLEALKSHVHSLKGSSAGAGVVGISTLCRQIEECLHGGQIDGIYPRFQRIINVYSSVEKEFQDWK